MNAERCETAAVETAAAATVAITQAIPFTGTVSLCVVRFVLFNLEFPGKT